jgi:hypothetical protein
LKAKVSDPAGRTTEDVLNGAGQQIYAGSPFSTYPSGIWGSGAAKAGAATKKGTDLGIDLLAGSLAGGALIGGLAEIKVISPFRLLRTESLAGRASSKHVRELAESMRTNGWVGDPIEVFRVDDDFYIINGHHRVAAAKSIPGMEVPYRELSVDELKAYDYNGAEDVVRANAELGPDRLR